MKLELYDTYNICTAYVTAMEYGDLSGLDTDLDIDQVNEFLESLPDNCTFNWSDNEPGFCRDEISGLMADCIELEVYTAK